MGGKKTLVVKIGTSSLTERSGALAPDKLRRLTLQAAELREAGHQVMIVTSAAIAAGYPLLGYHERPTAVAAKQASAAVGQGLLMEEYTRALAEKGVVAAQLLLTRDDFRDRRRYQNAFNALEVLLKRGAVPIINENDTVSIAELKLGDNDMLSAQVAAMVHADTLIIVTDTDGLYTADPRTDPEARLIERVERATPELEARAGGPGSANGTGGMATKVKAARLATAAGVQVVICSGAAPGILAQAAEGTARGTWFEPRRGMKTRLQWMAFYAPTAGNLYIDAGAESALCRGGKSLLPAGIRAVEGDFAPGDVVRVYRSGSDVCLGRGAALYGAAELKRIMGQPGAHPEAIHRDDWVADMDLEEDGE